MQLFPSTRQTAQGEIPQTNTHMLEMELISPVLSNVLCFQTFPLQVSGKRQSDSLTLYKDTSLQNSLITV